MGEVPSDGMRRRRRNGRALAILGLVATMLWLTGCMERLFYLPTREPTPAPTWLSPRAEAVWFESRDGTRLRGWFVPALDRPSRDAATVFHVHGNAGSIMGHVGFVEHLPAAGFNVFLFDYRGYGESEGGAWGRAALIEDTKAALATLRARPDIDGSRIAIYGQSLGGAIAVIAMADDLAAGGDLRGAVLESPFASWRDAAATNIGGDPPGWWSRALATWLIKDNVTDADGRPIARPIDAIARIDRPILIVHGDADSIVAVGHGRRLAAAAPLATLLIVSGGEHNSLQFAHAEVRPAMVEFLRGATAQDR